VCLHPHLSGPGTGGAWRFPPLSPSRLKHCTEDGWGAEDFCLWLAARKAPLSLCLQEKWAALGEGKEKDQPASKEEAKLLALLKGLAEEADSQLDGKEVSHKQRQYAVLAV